MEKDSLVPLDLTKMTKTELEDLEAQVVKAKNLVKEAFDMKESALKILNAVEEETNKLVQLRFGREGTELKMQMLSSFKPERLPMAVANFFCQDLASKYSKYPFGSLPGDLFYEEWATAIARVSAEVCRKYHGLIKEMTAEPAQAIDVDKLLVAGELRKQPEHP